MKKICIFQDTESPGKTCDLLEAAARIYGRDGFESHALLLNGLNGLDGSAKDFSGRFHHLICVDKGQVNDYDARALAGIIESLHREKGFDSILIPATTLGKMIAPRLAKRLGTGLAAGITDIASRKEGLEITRPACTGKLLEKIHLQIPVQGPLEGPGPLLMSIRPNAFEYTPQELVQTRISRYEGPVVSSGTLKRLHMEKNRETRDIRDYAVLISGGSGAKDCFSQLNGLAQALGGTVSASRKLVDQGIAPRGIQVGQSGKTVSPRLYLAIGIHGSMQHMAGLRGVESIISVNTNSHAPICSQSDIVVQGDAATFIKKLTEKISTDRSTNARS